MRASSLSPQIKIKALEVVPRRLLLLSFVAKIIEPETLLFILMLFLLANIISIELKEAPESTRAKVSMFSIVIGTYKEWLVFTILFASFFLTVIVCRQATNIYVHTAVVVFLIIQVDSGR